VLVATALTGHRVITTSHTADIASVYAPILHQAFEPFLVSAAITEVMTQRVIRGAARVVPRAAVLTPGDDWREFLCTGPGLRDIRKRAVAFPLISLSRPRAQSRPHYLAPVAEQT